MLPPPSPKQSRIIWFGVTGLAIGVLLLLLAVVLKGLAISISVLSPVLFPLAVAGIAAYLLDPLVNFFERFKIPRLRAIILVFVTLLVLVVGMLGTVVPRLVLESKDLVIKLPEYSKKVHTKVEAWLEKRTSLILFPAPKSPGRLTNDLNAATSITNQTMPGGSLTNTAPTRTGRWLDPAFSDKMVDWLSKTAPKIGNWILSQVGRVASWVGFFLGLLLVPVYLFYFLLDKDGIIDNWQNFVPFEDSRLKEEIIFVITSINDCLIVFFRGQVLVALCMGSLLTIGFLAIGVPYAFLLGAVAAVLGIIPYLGVALSLIPAVTLAVMQFGDWLHPVLVVGLFALVNMLEGLVISPKIIGDRVGLHPLTIIVAVMVGTTLLGGVLGGVLAIPLTAALRAIMYRYVWRKSAKTTVVSLPPTAAP